MTVYLVGAGPGDPGLLTIRGAELIKKADAVVYDRLANFELLNMTKSGAVLIAAGKGPGDVDLTQDETNEKLVELGQKFDCVVRLKGGDPFVFGRGGEEAQILIDNKIDFEVVPGITSAIASLAYAGVPITQRGISTNFTIVTGHEDPSKPREQVKWTELAKIEGTIAVLMGVANRALIAQSLIEGGKSSSTPVVIVRNGTTNHQQTLRTTLAELGDVEAKSPSIIAIGEVADMELNWFENRPLLGKKIVVTRAREQQSEIAKELTQLGAHVIQAPAIKIDPIEFEIPDLQNVSYVVFTSTNGVHITMDRLNKADIDSRYFANSCVAAIGESTAAALREYGIIADIVPSRFVAEELVEMFPDADSETRNIVCFRASKVRDALEVGLSEKGYQLRNVDVYDTLITDVNAETLEALKVADAITFASSSTVKNAIELFGIETVSSIPVKVSIGPVTSAAMRKAGVEPTCEANPHTISGIVQALLDKFN